MTTHITFDESLRILIREKLASGALARNGIHGVLGGPGKGQICVACGTNQWKEPVRHGGHRLGAQQEGRSVSRQVLPDLGSGETRTGDVTLRSLV